MSFESVLLEDLAAPQKNAIVGGPFGSNLVSKDYVDQGTPVIRGQNMGGRWVSGDFAYVSAMKADALSPNKARPGDLIFTQRGTLGQVSIVPSGPYDEYIVSQSQMKVTLDPERADVRFLYYVFRSPEQLEYIQNTAIQTGVPHTNLGILKKTPLKLPSIHTQRQIATILGTLDDRIDLLRETNATLEAIAQALFKSWFVDFDPVRAKMAGRAPEGMDEATAALFPDALEEAELGVVPKGWQFGTVGDIAQLKKGTVNPGSQPDAMFEHFSLPAFDDGCRPVVELGEAIKSNKTPVPSDAVLLSKLNPHIPRVWLPVSCGSNAVCSTEFLVFQPVGAGSKELIYCTFSSPDFILRLQQLVTGTSNSHQRIKPDQVALMSCVVPPKDIASQFELSLRPIFERVHANREQAQTLASLRDALLPRLISGQLRLPEAEAQAQMEAVA